MLDGGDRQFGHVRGFETNGTVSYCKNDGVDDAIGSSATTKLSLPTSHTQALRCAATMCRNAVNHFECSKMGIFLRAL